ncbi:MAG: hypothetical protein RIE58_07870 [Vicingaceae bacterium]
MKNDKKEKPSKPAQRPKPTTQPSKPLREKKEYGNMPKIDPKRGSEIPPKKSDK